MLYSEFDFSRFFGVVLLFSVTVTVINPGNVILGGYDNCIHVYRYALLEYQTNGSDQHGSDDPEAVHILDHIHR